MGAFFIGFSSLFAEMPQDSGLVDLSAHVLDVDKWHIESSYKIDSMAAYKDFEKLEIGNMCLGNGENRWLEPKTIFGAHVLKKLCL